MITGDVIVTYREGTNEACTTGDLFHWPSGHSVRIERDAELILFSPQVEHTAVMDHILDKPPRLRADRRRGTSPHRPATEHSIGAFTVDHGYWIGSTPISAAHPPAVADGVAVGC